MRPFMAKKEICGLVWNFLFKQLNYRTDGRQERNKEWKLERGRGLLL